MQKNYLFGGVTIVFIKEKLLKCSICDKSIEANERILVELTLPNATKMPYGTLDEALYKQAEKVICSKCKS